MQLKDKLGRANPKYLQSLRAQMPGEGREERELVSISYFFVFTNGHILMHATSMHEVQSLN